MTIASILVRMTDEFANARRDLSKLYDANADLWINARNKSDLPEKQYLAKIASMLPNASKILDLGSGDGIVSEYFENQGHSIVAVDTSPKLLAALKIRLPKAKTIICDIREINLNEQFELVLIWHSLFHLSGTEQRNLLNKISQNISNKGILAFTSGDFEGEILGEFASKALYHSSLSPVKYSQILQDNGFEIISKTLNDEQTGNISVWIARKT